jgi:hypothetical protein
MVLNKFEKAKRDSWLVKQVKAFYTKMLQPKSTMFQILNFFHRINVDFKTEASEEDKVLTGALKGRRLPKRAAPPVWVSCFLDFWEGQKKKSFAHFSFVVVHENKDTLTRALCLARALAADASLRSIHPRFVDKTRRSAPKLRSKRTTALQKWSGDP